MSIGISHKRSRFENMHWIRADQTRSLLFVSCSAESQVLVSVIQLGEIDPHLQQHFGGDGAALVVAQCHPRPGDAPLHPHLIRPAPSASQCAPQPKEKPTGLQRPYFPLAGRLGDAAALQRRTPFACLKNKNRKTTKVESELGIECKPTPARCAIFDRSRFGCVSGRAHFHETEEAGG